MIEINIEIVTFPGSCDVSLCINIDGTAYGTMCVQYCGWGGICGGDCSQGYCTSYCANTCITRCAMGGCSGKRKKDPTLVVGSITNILSLLDPLLGLLNLHSLSSTVRTQIASRIT